MKNRLPFWYALKFCHQAQRETRMKVKVFEASICCNPCLSLSNCQYCQSIKDHFWHLWICEYMRGKSILTWKPPLGIRHLGEWSRGLRWGYFGSKLPTTWSKKTFPEGVAGVVLIDGWMDVTNVTNVSSFVHPLVVWKLKFSLDRGDPRIKGTERNPTKHQQRYQTKVNSKLNFFWMPK